MSKILNYIIAFELGVEGVGIANASDLPKGYKTKEAVKDSAGVGYCGRFASNASGFYVSEGNFEILKGLASVCNRHGDIIILSNGGKYTQTEWRGDRDTKTLIELMKEADKSIRKDKVITPAEVKKVEKRIHKEYAKEYLNGFEERYLQQQTQRLDSLYQVGEDILRKRNIKQKR